jgi:hypothetical protein
MKFMGYWLVTAGAIAALAVWPAFVNHQTAEAGVAAVSSPAPVDRDYLRRDALVTFWEGAERERHTNDMLSPRQLAGQYLQRYRENGDIDDVLRAEAMARRSLAIQPRNIGAIAELASVMLTLHRFREALVYVDQIVPYDPHGAEFLAQKASLQMELGEYGRARATLGAIRADQQHAIQTETIRSRYQEETGNLAGARALLADAMLQFDTNVSASAQARAWYHFRAGELAFAAGDNDGAIADERAALELFPTYNLALKDLAKFELANHRYSEALDAATRGAQITPFPETLGYEADAQAALGQSAAAAATRDTIFTIERIGNSYRVNDRLLAIYYADHGLRPADALTIARREAALRGDEIYAQDTLAWAAAMDGRWAEARRASLVAMRYDTADPILQFHAGAIALHANQPAEAKRRLTRALALNPNFHPTYADEARRMLARL